MSFKVNDLSSSQAIISLRNNQKTLTESLARFSSGKRIVKAADDASSMAIANSLGSQARGLGQSIRNATDAIAMAQVADGALGESANLIASIREKAVQAANASQSSESRQAIQADISKSLAALNDIAQNTSYNGQRLLSGSFVDKSFQVGASSGQTVSMNIDAADSGSIGNDQGSLSTINVSTLEGAQQAIGIADGALADINAMRSDIGSTQNQLESTINNISLTRVNVVAAESQISDLDFAEESMIFAKMEVLSKAQSFALAQSKDVNKQGIMDLLQG